MNEHPVNEQPETQEAPAQEVQPQEQAPVLGQEQVHEPQAEEPQAEEPQAELPQAELPQTQEPPQERKPEQIASDERRKAAQANWQRLVDAKSSGESVEGVVKAPVKGGLLVDISGYRGFLPASQTGVAKGSSLETLVKTTISLKVLDVDEARKRVVVSHRRAMQEQRRSERQELIRALK